MKHYEETDRILAGETQRQTNEMELIASENYVSQHVLHALGSVLTNKYSEGYPRKRYYAGQEFTDAAEELAQQRACQLFRANYANVQPLSGAPANLAVYFGLLKQGDTILAQDIAHGGHLTHGAPVSVTSKLWNAVHYGVEPDSFRIDYGQLAEQARKHRPRMIVAGFSSYSRDVDWQTIREIADEVGALTLADISHIGGLVAAGELENPLDAQFDVVTTTTHKTLRGPRGGLILTNDAELHKKIDKAVFPGLQGGPHMNNILAKAVALGEAAEPAFKDYAAATIANSRTLAHALLEHDVPVLSGGTDNHLSVFNCFERFGLGGKAAQDLLESAGLSTNRNGIAWDTRKPFDPSGIRVGSPAMTTRGMDADEFARVGEMIVEVLENPTSDTVQNVREEVRDICRRHPLPGM